MEIIILLSSSGAAGLFTYIYLDYLSLFDTEKLEIKKMISIMFSLINVSIFFIINNLISLFNWYEFITNLISIIAAIVIIILTNTFLYPPLIKYFRIVMNKKREEQGLNPFVDSFAIDSILQKSTKFYIERYNKADAAPVYQGILDKHQLTEGFDSIFIIEPTPKIKDKEKILETYIYQPSNTDYYFKIYQIKD